jgi:aspartate aminotransferase
MAISRKIEHFMTKASWIRKMFEEGQRLKEEVGADRVFDFSLGNPIFEPPEAYLEILRSLVNKPPQGLHRYMPNAGYPEVRSKVAAYLAEDTGASVESADVIMTCGAGGALNVALNALLDPGDEVVVVAPFFPEYRFYVDNQGGRLVVAESGPDFDLDLDSLDRAIGERTKAVILNSPNNPTGRMYSPERLREFGEMLLHKGKSTGRVVSILSDEPYRKIVFDGNKAPSIFAAYQNTILIASHSKDLGLAGERIGFAAIGPAHADRDALRGAMTFANRTLGFVNAPALFQLSVADAQRMSVPIEKYQELRDILCAGLSEAGIRYIRPQGAFYLFPETPTSDDLAFVHALQKYNLLAVPGSGFGRSGHMRLSFCVKRRVIEQALPIFKQVMQESAV